MSHKCEAVLITCEDFRLHRRKDGRSYIAEFIKNLGVNCDLITRGGGIQDLVRPSEPGLDKSVLRDLRVSVKLHGVKTIYLLNHEDCGAYGSMNFSSREEELDRHFKDLRTAKKVIAKEFPGPDIRLYFGELEPDTNDVFIIKSI